MGKRDNAWLEKLMYEVWEDHFNDIPRKNLVLIKFGRRSKRQLGSIKWVRNSTKVKMLLRQKGDEMKGQDDRRVSLITITSLYKNLKVPEYVVKETIAHEMTHYAHGFFSPLKKIFRHPHLGGLIRREMEERGLGELHRRSKKWLKTNWRHR